MGDVRVRFAPSPTGEPHVGWAHTAIFNWLFARHAGGTFVMRIEDTDQGRNVPEAPAVFERTLAWFGLDYDEGLSRGGPFGPYQQSERLGLYGPVAERLIAEGKAYPCFCTPEHLAERREAQRLEKLPPRYEGTCRNLPPEERQGRIAAGESYALRLIVPTEGKTSFQDLIRGEIAVENRVLDDFVIMKSGGMPAYNFACVVDDHLMRMTHIIRGEEHVSNTPKQILIYEALDLEPPKFAHVPMILAPDRSKLSKRHGATSVREFEQDGILPEALVNYLMLLNWSPGEGDDEVIDVHTAAQRFRMEDVQKSAAIYDVKKLAWLNALYLRRLSVDELAQRARPFFEHAGLLEPGAGEAVLRVACELGQERAQTLRELAEASRYLFEEPDAYDPAGVQKHFGKPEASERLGDVLDHLNTLDPWSHDTIEATFNVLATEAGAPRGEFIHPTRLAVTGRTVGPSLFELLAAVGKERVLARLERARTYITEANDVLRRP